MNGAQKAMEKQQERLETLRQAYRAEQDKLGALHDQVKELKQVQRDHDSADPDDVLAAQEAQRNIDATLAAIKAQRARRAETRTRLQKYERWLQGPTARDRRGGLELQPDG